MESLQFTPFLIAYITTAAIALFLAFIAWNLKPINGSKVLSAVLIAVFIWMSAYSIELISTKLSVKLFFIRFEYIGLISAIYLWFIFIINYTEYKKLNKPWVFISVAIIPLFTVIQIIFIKQHNFFYKNYSIETISNLQLLAKTYSVGFYTWAGYAYFLILASLFLVVYKAISMPKMYRKQILPIAIAATTLILPNTLYIIGYNPIAPFDPTGIGFIIVLIIILYSLNVQSFLNVVPVAHDIVFKNAKMGIIILDDREQIIDINPSGLNILDGIDKDCIGKPITDYLNEYKELKEQLKLDESIIEINLGQKNITYEIKMAPLLKSNGKKYGTLLMLWDISELKAAFYELDAYSHTVAHDLKSPIGQMVGYANLVQNIEGSSNEVKSMLETIVQSGLKMNDIIDELLKLAQIRSIDPKDAKKIDLNHVIPEVLKRVIPEDAKQISISKPTNWPYVMGNHIWIEEIWANLISNAYKYGGNPLIIDLGFKEKGNFYHFYVSDNGIGISNEEKKKLFTEYSRLSKHKHKVIGHGLGLSIVQRIVKKMGGKIWVESELEKGSTFFFSIPKI